MRNINKLTPKKAIIFKNEQNEELILIQNETIVKVVTDGLEHEEEIRGLITFIDEDGITLNNNSRFPIFWEYILEVNIMKYRIWDKVNEEFLDSQKYCVNGYGEVMTTKGDVLLDQKAFNIIPEEQIKY